MLQVRSPVAQADALLRPQFAHIHHQMVHLSVPWRVTPPSPPLQSTPQHLTSQRKCLKPPITDLLHDFVDVSEQVFGGADVRPNMGGFVHNYAANGGVAAVPMACFTPKQVRGLAHRLHVVCVLNPKAAPGHFPTMRLLYLRHQFPLFCSRTHRSEPHDVI